MEKERLLALADGFEFAKSMVDERVMKPMGLVAGGDEWVEVKIAPNV